ncbi:unnamed protein product, partial [Anisakis simplex]|uniref:Btz domain-containing protein n=1 Tax=Anisakis simplex TaxID=6269 RepID=A0A0M3JNR1_ANISI
MFQWIVIGVPKTSPSTSSNRYDGEWGNRSPRRGSDQNRDRYGSGRSKASRRRDHPDRPALPEEDHYDDSRANRNSRDYRSKDYEAHQNQMVARGQFSGRDTKASGSRGEMGISTNRARRADQRFDSSEVKTRNADDQWRKTTEKSQAHSPTRIRADGWRS